jgi:hypothetical protein
MVHLVSHWNGGGFKILFWSPCALQEHCLEDLGFGFDTYVKKYLLLSFDNFAITNNTIFMTFPNKSKALMKWLIDRMLKVENFYDEQIMNTKMTKVQTQFVQYTSKDETDICGFTEP